MFSTAIGFKEHGGRVRGMSSKLSIRDGFEKDRARYRSHDHYKEEIVAVAESAMEERFKDLFFATLAEQQLSGLLVINVSREVGQQQMVVMLPPVFAKLVQHVHRVVLPQPQLSNTRWIP